jgi:hypothetical protein
MRVRMIRQPKFEDVEDFASTRFEVGQVYQVGPRLAELLLATGCAEPERRPSQHDQAADNKSR